MFFSRMKMVFAWLLAALTLTLCGAELTDTVAEYDTKSGLKVVMQPVFIPNLPDDLAGLRIVLIADIHFANPFVRRREFTAIPEEINRLMPDLVLFAGDVFDKTFDYAKDGAEVTRILTGIRAKYGVYAIRGNHDRAHYWMDTTVLPDAGITPLTDKTFSLLIGKTALPIFAFDDHDWRSTRKINEAPHLADLNKIQANKTPVLVWVHRPEFFDLICNSVPALVLAGHTHGGLVNIIGIPDGALVNLVVPSKDIKYPRGLYEAGNKKLYVTSGVGGNFYSNFRVRIPPEIVLITLRKLPAPAE